MTTISNSTQVLVENVNSVQDLLSCMTSLDKSQFNACIFAVDLSECDFTPYGSWSEEHYTRNCLYCDDKYEAILLCWEKGQYTPIHDHGGEECWVYFAQGNFEEIVYTIDENQKLIASTKRKARSGDLSYMIDFMGVHSLRHCSKERGMSLH